MSLILLFTGIKKGQLFLLSINGKQIACTGGEYHIHIFSLIDLLNFMDNRDDKRIFLLLLPLAIVSSQDMDIATEMILNALQEIFGKQFCSQLARSIVYGLMEG